MIDISYTDIIKELETYVKGKGINIEYSEWKFKNRSKLENRDKEGNSSVIRFRDKLTIKCPWNWTALCIKPYAAEEIYIQEQDHFYKNRVEAGFQFSLTTNIKMDLYYLWELEKDNGSWSNNIHAICTQLALNY